MAEDNPLKQVHDALWQLLEDRTEFTDLVPVGNRIKAVPAVRSPDKEAMAPQDFPQVRIIVVGIEPKLWVSSNSSTLHVAWEIQITTDQQEFSYVYAVTWAVFMALHDWPSTLQALTWNDKVFVTKCVPGEATLGQSEAMLEAGVRGWSTLWAGITQMAFSIIDLQGG
jgi:hypothetical protein